jgi:hypothetical protein
MVTKATNSVLNLVNPPIDNMVLLEGTLDNVAIGTTVPAEAHVTSLEVTDLDSVLVGVPNGVLTEVGIGPGLSLIANVLDVVSQPPVIDRILLTESSTWYCNFTIGDDGTGDGTSGNPWKTIQYTFDTLTQTIDGGGFNVTIIQQAGSGADTVGFICKKSIPGVAEFNLIINGGINTTATSGIGVSHAVVNISGSGTIQGSAFDISVNEAGFITVTGVTLGACSNTKLYAQFGGIALIKGSYTDSGNSGAHWTVDSGGQISVYPASTISISGIPSYSVAFARASGNATIIATLASFSGSATGPRFRCELGGGIFTNSQGLTFLPGSIAGTIEAPGWYDFESTAQDTTVGFSTGNCLFSYLSSSQLILTPINGNTLVINSQREVVPNSVILSNSGLTPSTFYYVYAYMNGLTMTLEASTVAPTWDSNKIRTKTGDPTRSLIGACFTDTSGDFVFDNSHLGVISYYNRRKLFGKMFFADDQSTASTTWVELNSLIRIQFISWDDEDIDFSVNGQAINTLTTNTTMTGVSIDGVFPTLSSLDEIGGSSTAAPNHAISQTLVGTAQAPVTVNAIHYATLIGIVGGGSGQWFGDQVTIPGDAQKILFTLAVRG